ncbi:MAG TPA: glycosyltransferase family 4 protein [Chloroflexia bacterium]|jgi:glycosyltransferase involved in cell wall biosynthesis
MRILITTSQVPFIRGGAELHAEGLRDALRAEGHQAEIVAIPFKWYPAERILAHMAACRLLDLSEIGRMTIDMVIGLKFPAYLVPHPNKVLWILHQHRQAYELWEHPMGDLHLEPNGAYVREVIQQADRTYIGQAKAVFANSRTVAGRLKEYCGLDSTPLYHPPHQAEKFYCAEAEEDLLFPSRIGTMKRQELVVQALALTTQPVTVSFMGAADREEYAQKLQGMANELGLGERVRWLGAVSEEEKFRLYAHSLGVIFPPVDEDYGYITLEAMLSSKPVITCTDSGGPLEFVRDGETGYIAEPSPEGLAATLDRLWEDRTRAKSLGEAGRELYDSLGISWPTVVKKLLAGS